MKKCFRCKKNKSIKRFHKDKTRNDGLSYRCKECDSEIGKLYRKTHPEKVKNLIATWQKKYPEKCREAVKKYRMVHPERVLKQRRKYRKAHLKEIATYARQRRNTTVGKLNDRMTSNIRQSLSGLKTGRHWEILVGYTVVDLKDHLEKQFTEGMTWENIGQWHIDHKIPKSTFTFETADSLGFKLCWALSNLQPLWAHDNQKKSNKLLYEERC